MADDVLMNEKLWAHFVGDNESINADVDSIRLFVRDSLWKKVVRVCDLGVVLSFVHNVYYDEGLRHAIHYLLLEAVIVQAVVCLPEVWRLASHFRGRNG